MKVGGHDASTRSRRRMLPAPPREAVIRGSGRAGTRVGAVGKSARNAAVSIPELVAGLEGPSLPLHGQWSVGLGRILGGHPSVPDGARGALALLDRFGHLRISPEGIGFDGDEVDWKDIDEIRFGPVVDVVTSGALEHEVRRITSLLPPLPGRSWLIRQAIDLLIALCMAATGAGVDDEDSQSQVPVAVVYRKRMRKRDMPPGLFVALVAASTSGVSETIKSMAGDHGITVTAAPPSRSRRQAVVLRQVAGGVSAFMHRTENQGAIAGPTDLPMIIGDD